MQLALTHSEMQRKVAYIRISTVVLHPYEQEIWANVHETRDSIGLISYADCLRLSPVISAQFTLQMCVAA